MISLIWAMDDNWLIGKGNQMAWHVKEDLLYYKRKTEGKTVLMGYNTYVSLKGYYKTKPLPYGKIFVVTSKNIILEDAYIVENLNEFIENLDEDIFVVGGRSIYEQMLPYANQLYISFIKGSHDGDVYFPKFDLESYKLVFFEETDSVKYTIYEKSKLV